MAWRRRRRRRKGEKIFCSTHLYTCLKVSMIFILDWGIYNWLHLWVKWLRIKQSTVVNCFYSFEWVSKWFVVWMNLLSVGALTISVTFLPCRFSRVEACDFVVTSMCVCVCVCVDGCGVTCKLSLLVTLLFSLVLMWSDFQCSVKVAKPFQWPTEQLTVTIDIPSCHTSTLALH